MRVGGAVETLEHALPDQFTRKIDVLDSRPRLVVDREGRIIWQSENATALLQEPVPLRLHGGYLVADGPGRRSLQEFLKAVDSEDATALLRGTDRRHWVMLRGWALHGRPDHVALIASLSVPYKGVVESGLARVLRLTSAEARVLDAFARSNRPREIAEQMTISLSTVRSHLKQIHSKAGVESAVQLSQLVRSYCAQ